MSELEEQRLKDLEKVREEYHPIENFNWGSFGSHEVVDRSSLLMDTWAKFIMEHPTTILDAEAYEKAQKALIAIYEYYQCVAKKHLK